MKNIAIVYHSGLRSYRSHCSAYLHWCAKRFWFEKKWQHKIVAGFTNGHSLSGDKLNSLVQLAVFAAQHGMIWVNQIEPNMSPDYKPGKANVLNRMASSLGSMEQLENDSPTSTPPSGDIETTELFGQHIANFLRRTRGKN